MESLGLSPYQKGSAFTARPDNEGNKASSHLPVMVCHGYMVTHI